MVRKNKLLLVDDEEDFRAIMAKFFTRRGLDFATAAGCMEALDCLSRDAFDVVIMDVSMPGINGVECMTEIKKLNQDVEVIILTGNASINTGLVGMKKGAFDYCLKPIDFDELMEKILLAREKASGQSGL